jgi:hypothetical protein
VKKSLGNVALVLLTLAEHACWVAHEALRKRLRG